MLLLLFIMFVSCQGFLLDGNTQAPTSGASLDDKRYNTIMGLLTEERRSRSRLEAIVAQELLALRQDIAKCQRGNGNGGNSQFNNQGSLANDTKVLKEEISKLKRDHELLKTEVAGLMQNNTVLTDKVMELKRNLTTIQTMQSELTLRNESSHLEKELQITNNKLNAVTNEADTRKQDCIALSERVQSTEQRLENSTKLLEAKQNITVLNLQKEISRGDQILQNKTEIMKTNQNRTFREIKQEYTNMFSQVKLEEQNLSNRTKSLETRHNSTSIKLQQQTALLQQELNKMSNRAKLVEQNLSDRTTSLEKQHISTSLKLEEKTVSLQQAQNSTSLKLQQQTELLQQELNKMSNRVALTTCKGAGDDKNGVIQFTDIKTANGVHNTDSIRNSGIFTCEHPGLYLISVYIQSYQLQNVYYVLKNNNTIAEGYSSLTTSVTVIQQLTVNDTISVTGKCMYTVATNLA